MSYPGNSRSISGSSNVSNYAWPVAITAASGAAGYGLYVAHDVATKFGSAVKESAMYAVEKAGDAVQYTEENIFTPLFLVLIAGTIVIIGGVVYLIQ